MLPETHPLIEAVTEPLANNAEQRMAARAFLGEKFDAAHPHIAETSTRIEAAGRRKFPELSKGVLWTLAALALAAVIFSNAGTFRFAHSVYNYDIFEPWKKPALPAGLTKEQRLLLGDPEMDDLVQKRQLHELAPENPAYFAEYAQAFVSENDRLPPNFLDSAARVAPDNAFFHWFAAGQIGKETYKKKTRSGPSPPPRMVDGVRLNPLPREMEFDITDPTAFAESLALVEKAAALPEFETYTNAMTSARVQLAPTGDLAEFTTALLYAYGGSSGMIRLRLVSDLFCAQAELLSKDGRQEEFLSLAERRDALITHLGRNPDQNLIGELVHAVIAMGTATNFHFAADRLGLEDLAKRYGQEMAAFQEQRDRLRIRDKKEPENFPEKEASMLTALALPMVSRQVEDAPPIAAVDFEPMRMAERELAGSLGVLALALLLPFAALLLFLFRFVVSPIIRLPAKQMAGVLGKMDWLWVIGLGVVCPILFFLTIIRLTPLGGRGYGLMYFQAALPGVQYTALLLTLLVAPALIVRWRLGKSLAPFHFEDRFTVPIALAAMAMLAVWSLAALPFIEFLEKNDSINGFTLAALAAPPALCVALIFANALRAILGKPHSRLAQAATAVAVLPAYPIAVLLLCSLTPIHHAEEKRWLAKETLLRIDPNAPDLGAYEFKIAAQKRKEINAITGLE